MKHSKLITFLALASFAHAGEKSLFNGKDLTGWSGQPGFWTVEDGAITGQTTAENPVKENTFMILDGVEVSDFELRFAYKFTDTGSGYGNSGVQFRSKVVKPEYSVVAGYQADFERGKTYSGILYEEKGRGILAKRGEKVVIKDGEAADKPAIEVTGEVGKSDEIQASIKEDEWNEFVVIAKGGHIQQFINGKQTVDVTDESKVGAKSGIISLQLHAGKPMKIQFKDLVLKTDD